MCFSMYSDMSRLISAVLVAEQELGERLGQLGLPDAGRAEEDERAARALRVLEAGPGAADGLGDGLDGVLLADDPLVELVLHAQELLGLLLGELVDGDAGPDREDLGDGLLVDLVEQVDAGGLDLALLGLLRGEELLLLVAEAAGLFEVLGLDGLLLGLDDTGRSRSRAPCSPAGVSMRLMRRREPASSMRSMALSGRWRSEM